MNRYFVTIFLTILFSISFTHAESEQTANKERVVGVFSGASPYDSLTKYRYEIGVAANDHPSDPENRGWFELLLSTGNNSSFSRLDAFDQINEDRFEISSFGRSTQFGTLDWFFGISYFSSALKIKNRYWSFPLNPKSDSVKTMSLGFNLGLGSRWRFSNNFFLSVDWIRWAQPLTNLNSSFDKGEFTSNFNDQNSLEEDHNKFLYYPRIELLKIKLGYFF